MSDAWCGCYLCRELMLDIYLNKIKPKMTKVLCEGFCFSVIAVNTIYHCTILLLATHNGK